MHLKKINPFMWCVALLLASNAPYAAEPSAATGNARIIKWVDDKGVTHYGDSLPAQFSGRDNSEINSQGVLVKRNKAVDPKIPVANRELNDQRRRDHALMAAYTTDQEIDLARDRNLQLDLAAVEALNQQKINSQTRLEASKKAAAGFKKRKKPIPADLSDELKANQEELTKIDKQITERNTSMEATRQRFDQDKKRFIELKSGPASTTTAQ